MIEMIGFSEQRMFASLPMKFITNGKNENGNNHDIMKSFSQLKIKSSRTKKR